MARRGEGEGGLILRGLTVGRTKSVEVEEGKTFEFVLFLYEFNELNVFFWAQRL